MFHILPNTSTFGIIFVVLFRFYRTYRKSSLSPRTQISPRIALNFEISPPFE